MPGKVVPPSTKLTSFNCPHCGTLTSQSWYRVYLDRIGKDGVPHLWTREGIESLKFDEDLESESRDRIFAFAKRVASGEMFLDFSLEARYLRGLAANLHISHCYTCSKPTVWHHDHIIYPPVRHEIEPNEDLPEDVARDFDEARQILDLSRRGAAALLRLAIQKLCRNLGEDGKNLNTDIANLVQKGLDPRVQKMLDTVRVIGNNAVHPGQMDLDDDRDTAVELLRLVNLIAEIMISQPKHVEEMYGRIPDAQRHAIEKRDGKKETPPEDAGEASGD